MTDGSASHAGGVAGSLEQPVAAQTGRWYRWALTMSGRTAGNLTPRLTGGSIVAGPALLSNTRHRGRLQAVTGNNRWSLSANPAFDGSVSALSLYLETAACLAQGTHYLWLEPQSDAGLPGPVSGPFVLEVI